MQAALNIRVPVTARRLGEIFISLRYGAGNLMDVRS
jgi:hypothetical protein